MQDTAILGWPKVFLQVSSSAPLADWFVRLSDVAPDGTVTMITGAGQSGAQRDSAANPSDLEPDRKYALPIELHVTSWVFPTGHRIRLAISNALWPMIWPTPYPDDHFVVARRPEHFAFGTSARPAGAARASAFHRARKETPLAGDVTIRRRHLAAAGLDRDARCAGRLDARRLERRRFQQVSVGPIERSRADELTSLRTPSRRSARARRRLDNRRTSRSHAGLERGAQSAAATKRISTIISSAI